MKNKIKKSHFLYKINIIYNGDKMKNIKYEREKVLKYAKRWAYDRNPQFYNFDNVGGDCTSFVSQCILAGSNVMNYILLHILLIHIIKRYQSMDCEK